VTFSLRFACSTNTIGRRGVLPLTYRKWLEEIPDLKCSMDSWERSGTERLGDGIRADCIQIIVPGRNVFFCISDASQSDRAKSKLRGYVIQKRLAVGGPVTTAAGPITANVA